MTEKVPTDRIPYAESLDAARASVRGCLLDADAAISDVTRHLASQGGKGLRSALLLTAASGADGCVPAQAVPAAAALEVLHLATLVHDDVVDDAATRRGQPSVQRKFGRKVAVLGGDYLFCRCFSMVSGLTASYPDRFGDFARAMTRVCLGEIEQLRHNLDVDLGIQGYLRIIAGKTAALFALAAYAGGIQAGETEQGARASGRFGFLFGMLFQIMDDCLDYEDDGGTARKTVQHDLAEGVITPPLIYSISKNPRLKGIVRSAAIHPADLHAILAEVTALDGVHRTWGLAGRYYRKAIRQLDRIADGDRRDRLRTFLDSAIGDRASRLEGSYEPLTSVRAGESAG